MTGGVPAEEESVITPEVNDQIDGSRVVDSCIREFNDKYHGRGAPAISTGIRALDRAIIGLRGKKVYVIAGRPGMGKTAMADTIRRSVMDQGYVVCEFSLEMGREEIGERELAFRAGVNSRKVQSGKEVSAEELARVMGVAGSIPTELWWVYDACFAIDDIVRQCMAAKKRAKREGKKIGLVIIDYLQLLGDVGTEGRQHSVSACSRASKLLSKELDSAVLVLSQLNRNCEYREDRRPILSDIRESGSVEQDADVIMFLYREHVYNPAIPPQDAEVIIRKQRSGPIGTVRVRFNPLTVHFDDVPPPPPTYSELETP